MSDRTIEAQRELVAKRIMGWRIDRWTYQDWWADEGGRPQCRVDIWGPDQVQSHAMMLAEAMRGMGYDVNRELRDGKLGRPYGCNAAFSDIRVKQEFWNEAGDKLERAIFAVAVEIAEMMEQEVKE